MSNFPLGIAGEVRMILYGTKKAVIGTEIFFRILTQMDI
jgi:hypothetical protein